MHIMTTSGWKPIASRVAALDPALCFPHFVTAAQRARRTEQRAAFNALLAEAVYSTITPLPTDPFEEIE